MRLPFTSAKEPFTPVPSRAGMSTSGVRRPCGRRRGGRCQACAARSVQDPHLHSPNLSLTHLQCEALCVSHHTACRFAQKTRFFPLGSGQAARCCRLAFCRVLMAQRASRSGPGAGSTGGRKRRPGKNLHDQAILRQGHTQAPSCPPYSRHPAVRRAGWRNSAAGDSVRRAVSVRRLRGCRLRGCRFRG